MEMEQDALADYAGKLSASIKAFNLMTPDFSRFCGAVNDYVSKLPTAGKTANASVIGRLMNNVRMGYYPTDIDHVKMITRGIEFPEGITTNVFDPCCGCGLALRTLAQGNNCYTYGVELDRFRAEEAQGRLHRVGFGSYFQSRISHDAFHVMLLNPPYISVITEGGHNARSEKRFPVDSMCHVVQGGLLVYIIPYYRLTADLCRILCDNFSDLTVWRFLDSEFKKFKQVAVMGVRRKKTDGTEQAQELYASVLEPGKLPTMADLPEHRYRLPAKPIKVDLFKGAEFNVAELAEQLKRSKSFSRLFEKSKLDGLNKRPLLPLSIGQVGLIGGSGLINGLVECETPHVIKGRIIKEIRHAEEDKTNRSGDTVSTTVTETVVNKMVFNILTPSGFKSLS
jgi:tRNA1(Val) A37 N6-methylase TrmN6